MLSDRQALHVALLCFLIACARPATAPPAAPFPPAPIHAPLRAGTSGDYLPLSIWRDDRVEGFAPALVAAFASAVGGDAGNGAGSPRAAGRHRSA
jgi:hypothetical protein